MSDVARATWELENNIAPASSIDDELWKYSHADHQAVQQAKPWKQDPHYFKNVKVSALALLKMAMHARSGGTIEVRAAHSILSALHAKRMMNAFR